MIKVWCEYATRVCGVPGKLLKVIGICTSQWLYNVKMHMWCTGFLSYWRQNLVTPIWKLLWNQSSKCPRQVFLQVSCSITWSRPSISSKLVLFQILKRSWCFKFWLNPSFNIAKDFWHLMSILKRILTL